MSALARLWHALRGCGPFKPVWDGSGRTNIWACVKCGDEHQRNLATGGHTGRHTAR